MKVLLAALLLLAPPALPALPAGVADDLAFARDVLADLDALADAPPAPFAAYAYTRGLVGLSSEPADLAPVDARAYLAGLAPGADLRALDALPRDAYDALGALLGAHAAAAQLLARGTTLEELEGVRARLLLDAERVLALRDHYRADGAPVDACGALYLYLGDAPQTIACDHAVTIAGYGDDVYLADAGGADLGEAALALDLGGDDVRTVNLSFPGGAYGGAYSGFGALLDLAGDDRYHATAYYPVPPFPGFTAAGIHGGAAQALPGPPSAGLLLDVDGNDTYFGEGGAAGINGGSGRGSSGALLDLGGTDRFEGIAHGLTTGINGGSNDGVAVFFDCGGGANLYTGASGERGGVNGGGEQSVTAFVSCGGDGSVYSGVANGGGVNAGGSGEAVSVFVLLEGDATLSGHARYGGVNAGAYRADTTIVSGHGSQRYEASMDGYGGMNGGALTGTSRLIDLDGDDAYVARTLGAAGANGGGLWAGVATLLDLAGDDTYDADVGGAPNPVSGILFFGVGGAATNGQGNVGCGALVDLGGSDAYRGAPAEPWTTDETAVDPATCSARLDSSYS